MGIETSVAKRKGKEFVELGNEKNPIINIPNSNTNNRGPKPAARRRPKRAAVVSPVQKLYDTCKKVFSNCGPGIVPSPDKIEKLRAVVADIKLEDVGLHPDMPYFRLPATTGTPPIIYLHIHECNKFSIGIFCFTPSGVIPLHNHPGMTVFSKLLFGKLHIKSYDWVENGASNGSAASDPSEEKQPEIQHPKETERYVQRVQEKKREAEQHGDEQPDVQVPEAKQSEVEEGESQQPEVQPPVRLAKVKIDSVFTAPCDPCILYPADGGNMHRFTADTACAVLDVLGPPYSDSEGRPCTYYNDFPFSKFSVDGVTVPEEESEGYAWLEERPEQPEDFKMIGDSYRGPKISKK